jgi:hypothetical protein
MPFEIEIFDATTDKVVGNPGPDWNGFRAQDEKQPVSTSQASAALSKRSGRVTRPTLRVPHPLRLRAPIRAGGLDVDWLKNIIETRLLECSIGPRSADAGADRKERQIIADRLKKSKLANPPAAASQPSDDKNALQARLGALLAKAKRQSMRLKPLYLKLEAGTLCFVVKGTPDGTPLDQGQQGQAWLAVLSHIDKINRLPTYRIVTKGTRTPPTIVPAGASAAAANLPSKTDSKESSTDAGQEPAKPLQFLKRVIAVHSCGHRQGKSAARVQCLQRVNRTTDRHGRRFGRELVCSISA